MKRLTPNLLIIAGLIILLAVSVACYIVTTKQLNSEIRQLQLTLNQTQADLDLTTDALTQINDTLEKERALVISGQGLRNFVSVDELKEFLANDHTNELKYIKEDFDCDDFARTLQANAFKAGYIMNCQNQFNHMFCMVIIGNGIYYIESMTDEVTYAADLDLVDK